MVYVIMVFVTSIIGGLVRLVTEKANINLRRVHNKRIGALLALIISLPMMIVSAVRYNVGSDFKTYESVYVFGDASILSANSHGFTLLINILRKVSDNPQIFFIISSIFIISLYSIYVGKYSSSIFLSIILFVVCRDYFSSMNLIRQYMAMVISLYSIPMFKRKNWIAAAFIVAIAMSFHPSALIIVPICVFATFKFSTWLELIITFGLLGIGSSLRGFLSYYVNAYTEYGKYFSSSTYGEGLFFVWDFIIYLGLLVIILLIKINNKGNFGFNDRLVEYSALFLVLVYGLTPFMPLNFNRIALIAKMISTIYLPGVLIKIENKQYRLLLTIMYVLVNLILTYVAIKSGNSGAYPYYSIFKMF